MNLVEFAKRMEGLGAQIERNAQMLKVDIALNVLAVVARSTPADTGLARTNWITSVGQISTRKIPTPAYPGKLLGMDELMNAQWAIGQGQIALHGIESLGGKAIYVQNNQPYIGALNRGRSLQAGGGFVERAVLKGIVIALGRKLVPDSSGGVLASGIHP